MSSWGQPRIACKEGQAGPDNQKCGERQDTSKARRQKPYVGRAMPSHSILTICRLGTVPSLGWPICRFWSTFWHFWTQLSKTQNHPGSSVSPPIWGGSLLFPRRNFHELWVFVKEQNKHTEEKTTEENSGSAPIQWAHWIRGLELWFGDFFMKLDNWCAECSVPSRSVVFCVARCPWVVLESRWIFGPLVRR